MLSQGDYVAFLNSDLQMTPHWLSPLVQRLESDEKIAFVGPKLLFPDGRISSAGVVGTNAHPICRGLNEPGDHERFNFPMDCISLCGAALLTRRALLKDRIGLFDPAYFHYFEETDLCFQARFLGYQVVYEPRSVLIHHLSKSCSDNKFLQEQFQKSKLYFNNKWKEFLNDGRLYEEKPCCCTYSGKRSQSVSL
jgi:GT2 family glycosyltransferase